MRLDEMELLTDTVTTRYYGKYRGQVVNNNDPANMGRLEVSVPDVLHGETAWAMPCVPYAGDGVGFYCLPDVGAGVWVEFEAGRVRSPIWVGCYWFKGQLPSEADAPTSRLWKTPKLTMRVDDNAGELLIQTGTSMKIEMSQSGGVTTSAMDQVKHSVSAIGVMSDSGGVGKVDVTAVSVVVNGGSLAVL